ncbi:AIG2-like protein [Nemania sp. FL0031]|nr:AIG2-like protein [Nemania sp. FL0031]
MSAEIPKPIFIYGTLRALPLLAWALTGDASNVSAVVKLVQPAKVSGYARYAVKHCDYPAVIKAEPRSSVDGYLVTLETTSQRIKLNNFEAGLYESTTVAVSVLSGEREISSTTVEADMYVWVGDRDALTADPWDFEAFERNRLGDWLDIFEGIELVDE